MMCFGLKDRKRLKTNHCVIVLLDDTQLVHELHASSTGQDLLDVVIKHLNLLETSYFGLRYLVPQSPANAISGPPKLEQVWLDVDKSATKQLKDVQPMTVYFGVKYYAPDPCKLAEEITRYQFFLQCKQDILHARLPVPFELAIELFALAVQSELGDYDPQRHQEAYVSEFQFLSGQSTELERRVAQFHRELIGQVPATAELNFLERVKWLDLYGCDLHPIQYEDNGEEYALGLNPSGVLVLRNKLKVAHYLWPRIVKTKCQGRCFLMDVMDSNKTTTGSANRNRFGFRLADKAASQRLRWSIEEHKSFHQLIQNSASLNQLAQRQHQQQVKFSQRFRNSIRSAIGPFASSTFHQQQQQLAQEHKLRSSMKSLHNQVAMVRQQQQYALDSRPPPTVVRMPSRRYSNRSLTRSGLYGQQQPLQTSSAAANGNGLPNVPHTMAESQRQQALLMMNQFNQMNGLIGKAHTLRPTSSKHDSRDGKKNPYYQQMMMMLNAANYPDIAILPPGRHVVQPSIYKAASVVNGINQLGKAADESKFAPDQRNGSAMMQFFNTRPQYPAYQTGHESPRSTKSAIAPSSVLRMASKELAKQHRLYANQQEAQPLLPFEQQHHPTGGDYYAYSRMESPRSLRSNRLASRHKSKSTNENLHLLHNTRYMVPLSNDDDNSNNITGAARSKMLLATTQQLMQQNQMRPPPPGYHSHSQPGKQRPSIGLDNESKIGKNDRMIHRSDACPSEGEDNYCCSRSDCSSVDDGESQARRRVPNQHHRRRRPVADQQRNLPARPIAIDEQQDWNAIRRRHNEFSNGKGFLTNNAFNLQSGNRANKPSYGEHEDINNNNPTSGSQLVRNITNKQATPILLSMNYDQSNVNSKAVQLLNLQRQQLHSQSSSDGTKSSLAASDSAPSSVASSPQQQQQAVTKSTNNNAADSTAASSTTSGYYAGTNSTGSASLDSDSQMADSKSITRVNQIVRPTNKASNFGFEWQQEGSRAKIAVGSYANRVSAIRTPMAAASQPRATKSLESRQQVDVNQRQQFYLGETGVGELETSPRQPAGQQQQWSPLSQIQQQAPASLKYVSFDV